MHMSYFESGEQAFICSSLKLLAAHCSSKSLNLRLDAADTLVFIVLDRVSHLETSLENNNAAPGVASQNSAAVSICTCLR